MLRKLIIIYLLFFSFSFALHAQTSITLKTAPENLEVFFNGNAIKPLSSANGHRTYRIPGEGILSFKADGYVTQEYHSSVLPARKNIVGIKLENQTSLFYKLGEYRTGRQPKSAYWSPDGKRLFVPLLDEHGVDVFRLRSTTFIFEKRLTVPNSRALGFVEALCDEKRRELWVSNMMENKAHIFNLDTLEYITSINSEGVFPKVIVQSPDGTVTAISNWVSKTVCTFDSDTKKLLHRIPVGATPRGMAFSNDGSKLYTAIYDEAVIAVIDMNQNKVIKRFQYHEGAGAARHIIYRDEKLYVSDMHRGTVNILNAETGALIKSRRIGPLINTIDMSPDGKRIFVSSRGRNNPVDYTLPGPDFGAIYIIKSDDLELEERIWGRNQPTGLAISPCGRYLAFTDFLDENLELYRFK